MDGFNKLRRVLERDSDRVRVARGDFQTASEIAQHLILACVLLTPRFDDDDLEFPENESLADTIREVIESLDALSDEEKMRAGNVVNTQWADVFRDA